MKKTGVRQMIFGILGSLACGVSVMGCYPLVPAYFTALYLEQVNGVVLLAFMYIGMTLFMPLTAAVKYGVTLIVMIGAVKLIEWANEGCPAFLAGVMAGLTTLILSFCGSLLEWKTSRTGQRYFGGSLYFWCGNPFKPRYTFPDGVDAGATENRGTAGAGKWRAAQKLCGVFSGAVPDIFKYECRKRKICCG